CGLRALLGLRSVLWLLGAFLWLLWRLLWFWARLRTSGVPPLTALPRGALTETFRRQNTSPFSGSDEAQPAARCFDTQRLCLLGDRLRDSRGISFYGRAPLFCGTLHPSPYGEVMDDSYNLDTVARELNNQEASGADDVGLTDRLDHWLRASSSRPR